MLEFRLSKDRIQVVKVLDNNTTVTTELVGQSRIQPANSRLFDYFSKEYYDVLPKGCKFIRTSPNGSTFVVIEEEPQIRTIKATINMESTIQKLERTGKLKEYGYEKINRRRETNNYTLSFPYIIHTYQFDAGQNLYTSGVFYRLAPLTNIKDYLIYSNLLNVSYPSGEICLGYTIPPLENDSIIDEVEKLQDVFWSKEFNIDITESYSLYNDDMYISDLLTWQYHTKMDPLFIYKVNWKKSPQTLFNMINNSVVLTNIGTRSIDIYDVFSKALYSQQEFLTTSDKMHFSSETYYLGKGIEISLGEIITINTEECELLGIIHEDIGEENITKLFLQKENKDTFLKVLTLDLTLKLIEQLQPKKITEVTFKNGEVASLNDVFIMKDYNNKNKYMKIKEIVKVDDHIEIQTYDSSWYLVKESDFKVVDLTNIVIGETKFTVGELYIELHFHTYFNSLLDSQRSFEILKFNSFNFKKGTNFLNLNFIRQNIDGEAVGDAIVLSETDIIKNQSRIIPFDDAVFYSGLCYQNGRLIGEFEKYSSIKYDGIIFVDDVKKVNDEKVINKLKEIVDNKKDAELQFLNSGINFSIKIGDLIVIGDGSNFERTLLTQTVVNFEMDTLHFYINSIDNFGEITKSIYMTFHDNYISINVPLIRHILLEYNNIKAGTIIRANRSGISSFPRKDINKIIGFLTDTKTPMVLCSNLQTIWFDDFEALFELDPKISSNIPISPIRTKFRTQAGDLSISRDELFISTSNNFINCSGKGSTFPMEPIKTFSINSPRLLERETIRFSESYIRPTMFGEYIIPNISSNRLTLRIDKRRIINV